MKKVTSLVLSVILCMCFCFGAYAEGPQPRWKQLSYLGITFDNYAGIINNAQLSSSAQSYNNDNVLSMTVTITKWNGSSFVDTDVSWTDSGNGLATVSKKFRLSSGTYRARTTVTLYDANGAYVETASLQSDDVTIP